MASKIEELIKAVYRKYKIELGAESQSGHPDEEALACFLEGKLGRPEADTINQHLITCPACAEIAALAASLVPEKELAAPPELIAAAKNIIAEKKADILEIILRAKQNLLELLQTTGDILVGQELVPAPLLRSRSIKDFKDEIIVLKDFGGLRVEIKIENKGGSIFSLAVVVKEKQTARLIKDLRVTLFQGDLELESYLTQEGKVVFEHVLLGKYLIQISNLDNGLASIALEIKL